MNKTGEVWTAQIKCFKMGSISALLDKQFKGYAYLNINHILEPKNDICQCIDEQASLKLFPFPKYFEYFNNFFTVICCHDKVIVGIKLTNKLVFRQINLLSLFRKN